ncbi:MAG TPA: NTP transferase domain-containing protein [Actinophytocola sp.]|uniref:molybdenum cofactor guanylyltransferase n=1 Tax=Actinophytocola sp. TaxID=1872138 RepID=UPI002DB98D91|nr:NTP transferase domain-containing protein [Actinophytocola sp.]HEU5475226.1 NTP transferase domain-containing protein [Actinophytocola sp.]
MAFAAVILAGGRASRMSGVDKVMIEVGGRTLLRRALDAVAGAEPVVVVGPARPVPGPVRWAREDPPGTGPLAGLAAGLAEVPPDTTEVAVLAADLLAAGLSTVDRLRAALRRAPDAAGALLVDQDGRRQWLIGVWRTGPLRRALPAEPAGRSLGSVLGALPVVEVAAGPGEAADLDTPNDLV